MPTPLRLALQGPDTNPGAAVPITEARVKSQSKAAVDWLVLLIPGDRYLPKKKKKGGEDKPPAWDPSSHLALGNKRNVRSISNRKERKRNHSRQGALPRISLHHHLWDSHASFLMSYRALPDS